MLLKRKTLAKRTSLASVFVFVLLAAIAASGADNWPQWRGPNSQGISNEKDVPLEWSLTKNIKWKIPVSGRGHSSPIVWNKHLFLTTAIEGAVTSGAKAVKHIINGEEVKFPDTLGADHSHTLKLISIDADTGAVNWERTVYEGRVLDDRQKHNSYASSTPATDGKYVFAYFGAEGLFCYDFDGKQVWKASVGQVAKMGYGEGTSPVLFENLIIVQADREVGEGSTLIAFDKLTGKQAWKTSRNNRATWSTPIIVRTNKRVELIASGAESVVAYDPATGKELWKSEGLVSHAIPTALASEEMVFVYAGSHDKRGYAIKLGGTGDLAKSDKILWTRNKGTAYVTSGILYDGKVYLISDGGVLSCVDARTGEVKYDNNRLKTSAPFFASPVAVSGKILLTNEAGETFVIESGEKFAVLGMNSLDDSVYASPAIANGRIYIRGASTLYCIGK